MSLVGGDNRSDGIFSYLMDVVLRYQSKSKWQDIGSNCVVAIENAVGI